MSFIDPTKYESIRKRLLSKVRMNYATGCWEWTACTDKDGYGLIQVGGNVLMRAPRVSFVIHGKSILPGHFVCHTCDTPCCISPDHLFSGTSDDNIADCMAKRRHTFGSKNGRARTTPEDVVLIRVAVASGEKQKVVAKRFGISRPAVSHICAGRTWTHVS